jgi:hypothetical protein
MGSGEGGAWLIQLAMGASLEPDSTCKSCDHPECTSMSGFHQTPIWLATKCGCKWKHTIHNATQDHMQSISETNKQRWLPVVPKWLASKGPSSCNPQWLAHLLGAVILLWPPIHPPFIRFPLPSPSPSVPDPDLLPLPSPVVCGPIEKQRWC